MTWATSEVSRSIVVDTFWASTKDELSSAEDALFLRIVFLEIIVR